MSLINKWPEEKNEDILGKSLKCEECDSSVSDESELINHKIIHEQESMLEIRNKVIEDLEKI